MEQHYNGKSPTVSSSGNATPSAALSWDRDVAGELPIPPCNHPLKSPSDILLMSLESLLIFGILEELANATGDSRIFILLYPNIHSSFDVEASQ
jgi:hypothetical protein